MTTIIRARVAHTPGDPFLESGALETFDDGAVAFEDGTILATGTYADVAAAYPDAEVLDRRDCFLFPGCVDTHVHYPQIPVIGAMGLQLLDWLATRTLPEEAKMADPAHARRTAQRFVRLLAANGTDERAGLRLALPERPGGALRRGRGDRPADRERARGLRPQPPTRARGHPGRGLPRLARADRPLARPQPAPLRGHAALQRLVPRGDARACCVLLDETPVRAVHQPRQREPRRDRVRPRAVPSARDYLGTYEDAGLLRECSVLAHNVPRVRQRA